MKIVSLKKIMLGDDSSLLAYLADLEAHFREREPGVLAFVPEEGRFERLRRDAHVLMNQYPDPAKRPGLFGIPVGVKDIFHVDEFITRAGSEVPADLLRGAEAESVRILKAAGVLIMGKTVTTEFAYFAPGPTRNPHNLRHTPGGSSSGSAAAVGAGLCPLALGTQTIGSIIRPAAYCGVVGYKPTYERISRAGVIPLSPSLDHIGAFSVDVSGVALAADVLVKGWDSAAVGARSGLPQLGIPNGEYLEYATSEGHDHFWANCNRLREAGFVIKSISTMLDYDAICTRHNLLLAAEAARVHTQWFSEHKDCYHAKTVELIERGQTIAGDDLVRARYGREELRCALHEMMDANQIDLWISPSATGVAPQGLESTGDPVMNLLWTHGGLPTIGMPSGKSSDGLYFGLQLAARFGDDELLFAWASEIEKVL